MLPRPGTPVGDGSIGANGPARQGSPAIGRRQAEHADGSSDARTGRLRPATRLALAPRCRRSGWRRRGTSCCHRSRWRPRRQALGTGDGRVVLAAEPRTPARRELVDLGRLAIGARRHERSLRVDAASSGGRWKEYIADFARCLSNMPAFECAFFRLIFRHALIGSQFDAQSLCICVAEDQIQSRLTAILQRPVSDGSSVSVSSPPSPGDEARQQLRVFSAPLLAAHENGRSIELRQQRLGIDAARSAIASGLAH